VAGTLITLDPFRGADRADAVRRRADRSHEDVDLPLSVSTWFDRTEIDDLPMREKLALTILVATAIVVAAVVVLAEDSTWAVQGGAGLVLLIAATTVIRAALGTADEEDDRSSPGPRRLWTWRPVGRRRRYGG
jgi:hypothetical protein